MDDPYVRKASAILLSAEKAEEDENIEEALRLYESGLQLLLARCQQLEEGDKRKRVFKVIEGYMSKAEFLKRAVEEEKNKKKTEPPEKPPGLMKKISGYFGGGEDTKKTNAKRVDKRKKPKGGFQPVRPPPETERPKTPPMPPVTRSRGRGARNHHQPVRGRSTTGTTRGRGGSHCGRTATATTAGGGGKNSELEEKILEELLDKSPGVSWEDIAGLDLAKQTLTESVILPSLRPDIFTGLRAPPKGVLLFGPPGTGKTLLAKAIATESKATFFSISASALTSKWLGEGEKLVRALFKVARDLQPSVIFLDEIDSVLSARKSSEHEASRRLKTEFLVQLDGAATSAEDRILVLGATNRPQELDEAVRRRMVKRIYIPLPDTTARRAMLNRLLSSQSVLMSERQAENLVMLLDGYSGSDIAALCKEAALGPIRELGMKIASVDAEDVRPINLDDFEAARRIIRPSVSPDDLKEYLLWDSEFGSRATM